MSQCVVIADDLTGGNATGVLLRKMNYQANTVLNLSEVAPEMLAACDCVIYPTDSRGLTPELAYARVREACEKLAGDDVKVWSHRIDSTLRGNLGSETDAILDFLGESYVAIAAPCFPATGRVVCGGYMLVEGIPLHKTSIAIDPKAPVKTSDVAALFRAQSKYGVGSIQMNELMHGKHYLADRIKELAAAFPDLSEHLLNIESNVKDLLTPFQQGWYYKREMGGSFSIKSVLPALFPDDPALNYHNLEGVHNGGEAMDLFPQIQFMEPAEKETARRNLLKYCELDTLAMVKVWEMLKNKTLEG